MAVSAQSSQNIVLEIYTTGIVAAQSNKFITRHGNGFQGLILWGEHKPRGYIRFGLRFLEALGGSLSERFCFNFDMGICEEDRQR